MQIYGLVAAKNESHAYKILEDLQNEYILECFAMENEVPYNPIYIGEGAYDAYVDSEGYLTLQEDINEYLYDFIPAPKKGYHLYGFEANYAEA